jgi:glycosyltransferase involved in cell wall biosynthesis
MTTDAVGGVWTYSLELSRELGERGIAVVLATMGPPPNVTQRADVRRLAHVTLCESEFQLEWMEAPWRDVELAGDWLLKLEWEFAPDIVHLNGYVHAALPWRAPAVVVGHSCVYSWWRAVHGQEPPVNWARYRDAVAAGLHAADGVVAPTRAILDALEHHYGGKNFLRAAVIPNGRHPAEFAPAAEKEPFVLSVGRLWDEAKNAAALAAIAPRIAWPMRVAGSVAGPEGRPRALPNLELLGCCAPRELAALYARAAIYALPARYEPFGLSALEAALSGCALVLGDIPSLRETWDGAALFVPPNDHDALHVAISELIDDASLRQCLALRARIRATEFTTERMTEDYLRLYRELLGRRSGPRASQETLRT